MGKIVYSHHYNIGFFGLERLHPFDSRKYGRAWKCLRKDLGRQLDEMHVPLKRLVDQEELLAVHRQQYLDRLRDSNYVARALELPLVSKLPWRAVDWFVLRPMRWATMGSMVAAKEAVKNGFAVNLSGGYHHAKPGGGEGFSIYSDIGLAVHTLRAEGLLSADDRVAYVDLDAHQGNGVCHVFMEDSRIFIFDMFNSTIYPGYDTEAHGRIDCKIPLTGSCTESEYLQTLNDRLPDFLDSAGRTKPVRLAIYNAGTDVYQYDELGGLNVSAQGIFKRDMIVVNQLRRRKIPTMMLLSGGYSRASYRLVADSVRELLTDY